MNKNLQAVMAACVIRILSNIDVQRAILLSKAQRWLCLITFAQQQSSHYATGIRDGKCRLKRWAPTRAKPN
jgi:hypothetical protein